MHSTQLIYLPHSKAYLSLYIQYTHKESFVILHDAEIKPCLG